MSSDRVTINEGSLKSMSNPSHRRGRLEKLLHWRRRYKNPLDPMDNQLRHPSCQSIKPWDAPDPTRFKHDENETRMVTSYWNNVTASQNWPISITIVRQNLHTGKPQCCCGIWNYREWPVGGRHYTVVNSIICTALQIYPWLAAWEPEALRCCRVDSYGYMMNRVPLIRRPQCQN